MRSIQRRTWRQIERQLLAAGAVAVVVMVASACGGSGGPPQTEAEVSWIELLAHVPDTESTRQSTMISDYARTRAELSLDRPPSDASEAALAEYANALLLGDGDGTGFYGGLFAGGVLKEPGSMRTEVGFSFVDIDQHVVAGGELDSYTIWRGRLDADAIDDAVHDDPVFSDLLEEESHEGVSYYTWGGDNDIDPERATALRRLGSGHKLAINDGVAYWSVLTQTMLEMIDAGTGASGSLADLEDYQLLAGALDELNVFVGSFSTSVSGGRADPETLCPLRCPGETLADVEEFLNEEPLLVPYGAFASGTGIDDRGRFSAVVIVHDDEASARENVDRLTERIEDGHSLYYGDPIPWTEEFFPDGSPSKDYLDVSSDGRLLTARIYSDDGSIWFRLVLSGLLLWED